MSGDYPTRRHLIAGVATFVVTHPPFHEKGSRDIGRPDSLATMKLRAPLAFVLLVLLPTSLLAAPPVSSKDALKAEVARMEDAFCAMAQEKGLLAAFEHFAAPDVAFIDTDPRKYRGPEAVRVRIGPDQPGAKLTWTASFTDVSDDGTLGYNYGRYESRRPGADGKESVHTGWFLTIWKRQPDGSWRYVMDTGAPDRPKPPEKKS
jgi:ketosteroid isomerase-like protein